MGMDETSMKFVLAGGEQKEFHMGSALAGYAAESIEVEWREIDEYLVTNCSIDLMHYINHSLRCRLLPGAELRIVQNYSESGGNDDDNQSES